MNSADIVTRLMIGAQVEACTVIAMIEQLQDERSSAYARGFAAGLEQAAGLRALLRKCRLFVTYSQFSAGYQDENGKSQSYRSEDVRDEIDAAIRALAAPPAESSQ